LKRENVITKDMNITEVYMIKSLLLKSPILLVISRIFLCINFQAKDSL